MRKTGAMPMSAGRAQAQLSLDARATATVHSGTAGPVSKRSSSTLVTTRHTATHRSASALPHFWQFARIS
jgi:hypothetical protein